MQIKIFTLPVYSSERSEDEVFFLKKHYWPHFVFLKKHVIFVS